MVRPEYIDALDERISTLEQKLEVASAALEAQAIINQALLGEIRQTQTTLKEAVETIATLTDELEKLKAKENRTSNRLSETIGTFAAFSNAVTEKLR